MREEGKEIYLSVITTYYGYDGKEEMLIPLKIGEELQGFNRLRRLDRALEVGHRLRAYEEVI